MSGDLESEAGKSPPVALFRLSKMNAASAFPETRTVASAEQHSRRSLRIRRLVSEWEMAVLLSLAASIEKIRFITKGMPPIILDEV